MFKRSLCSIGLAATIVMGGSYTSYGQTSNFRHDHAVEAPRNNSGNNPAIQQQRNGACQNVRDFGQGVGAIGGGIGVLCLGLECRGRLSNPKKTHQDDTSGSRPREVHFKAINLGEQDLGVPQLLGP